MSIVNIIMYHYVRPIKNSQYPKIKGLELERFKQQLDFLSSKFNFVTAEDVICSVKGGDKINSNSCWLTFDDGYRDHYLYVLPELLKRNIQGSFFPPVKSVTERQMLDVNSIHYILASTNLRELFQELNNQCQYFGINKSHLKQLWSEYAIPSKYDCREVAYIKRLLQFGLDEPYRSSIIRTLFKKFIGINQRDFADQLYMSHLEIKKLVNVGMYVGSHGYNHIWLNKVSKEDQQVEIDKSIDFLSTIGTKTTDWIMCYPYGGYNLETMQLIKDRNCVIGLTTDVGVANLESSDPLRLPRLDTNDFPS